MDGFKKCINLNCERFDQWLALDEFYRNKNFKNGREARCKLCQDDKTIEDIKLKKEMAEKLIEGYKKCTNLNCEKIDQWLKLKEFSKDKNKNGGCGSHCKKCISKYIKEYYNNENNEDRKRKYNTKYSIENKEKIKIYHKKYYKKNKIKILKQNKKWRNNNSEKMQKAQKRWIKKNKERYLFHNREYIKNRIKNDPNFKIARNLRIRISQLLCGKYKSGSAVKDMGCSIPGLKVYLESLWQPNMTWKNYGKWHIDHIIPLASFDLTDRKQFLKACHYTNLQPLWAKDNLKKGARII